MAKASTPYQPETANAELQETGGDHAMPADIAVLHIRGIVARNLDEQRPGNGSTLRAEMRMRSLRGALRKGWNKITPRLQ